MLVSLTVKNYALIKSLQVNLHGGYSVITGETGAGKSILLGALGLVLGNRADINALKDTTQKCIIEAEFDIVNYNLQSLFEEEDIDYEPNTIIRRELLPSGKSRAFVNDTPVNLKTLQEIQNELIDIHSQNDTRALAGKNYPFLVIDNLAGNQELLVEYKTQLKAYKKVSKELENLKLAQQEAKQQYDYNLHLYEELKEAKIEDVNEIETIESEIDKLSNVEEIKSSLAACLSVTTAEEIGTQSQLIQLKNALQKIEGYAISYESLFTRAESLQIELDDLVFELEKEYEKVDDNPDQLEQLNNRLSFLYSLLKKHVATHLSDLIGIREKLAQKVSQVEDAQSLLQDKEHEVEEFEKKCSKICQKLTARRKSTIPNFVKELEGILTHLGMENARFDVQMNPKESFGEYGVEDLDFVLSSNKGSQFGMLKKVASGGELSRIMLAIKVILSRVVKLPTIIFDEIDTGVSGEVANKIADLMKQMGENMQVITISHLAQVASKGACHYKVYKKDEASETVTHLKELSKEERVEEIAEMVGGKEKTQSALEHAKQLLSY